MRHSLRYIFIFISGFSLLLQSEQVPATTCTVFITQQSGQEDLYTLSFQDEEECNNALTEMARFLSKNPPYKIAYSIQDSPSFMEKNWDEFLFNIMKDSSLDPDLESCYLSTASLSTLPLMQGWSSSLTDAQPQTKEAEPFFALRLTAKDKKNISLLITDLADKSYLQLLANQASMNRKGDRARVVPPLRFIGYILSDPYLHKCLKTIEKDSIKYKEFINGFEKRMKDDAAKEDLLVYAPGFAELLQVDLQMVIDILESKNYAYLVKKLL
ncbi:MAG: hypothetical protein V4489_01335 [Chlamydiota bacterium]